MAPLEYNAENIPLDLSSSIISAILERFYGNLLILGFSDDRFPIFSLCIFKNIVLA